jgi:hypothetical protein
VSEGDGAIPNLGVLHLHLIHLAPSTK